MTRSVPALVGVLTLTAATSASLAQPTSGSPLAPPTNGPKHADPTWHAFTNATIHTAPGESREGVTLVVRDGRIVSLVGRNAAPVGARVWDMTGKHIYPGFIDAWVEVDAPKPDSSSPGAHWNSLVTPQRWVLDGAGISEDDKKSLREQGFVAAAISPSGGVFRGMGAVVSLGASPSDDSLTQPPVYNAHAFHSLGFETSGWTSGEYPTSHMGVMALYRQTLIDAEWERSVAGTKLDTAPSAITPLHAVGAPLLFDTDDPLETLLAGRIQREQETGPLLIVGGGSEYQYLDAITDIDATLIVPLRFPSKPDVSSVAKADDTDLERLMAWEQAPTNARRLIDAGARVAFTTEKLPRGDGFAKNLQRAIDHGLTPDAALAALTTTPAAALGVADSLGTIEPGKAASLIVTDDELFGKDTKILDVWVDGVRTPVEEPPTDALLGLWDITIDGGADARLRVEKGKVSIESGDGDDAKTVKAGAVEVTDDSISFTVKIDELAGDAPIIFTGVRDADRLTGAMMRPGGSPAQWTATRAHDPDAAEPGESAFEGGWTLKVSDAFSMEFRVKGDTVTTTQDDTKGEGREVSISGDRISFLVDDADDEARTYSVTGVLVGDSIDGTGTDPDGNAFTWVGTKKADEPEGADVPNLPGAPFGAYALADAPAQPDYIVITGATIWTSTPEGILRPDQFENGSLVVVKSGKIDYVGANKRLSLPANASVVRIDATGRHLTPGIIDAHSHTGLFRLGVNESGQAVTSECWIGDSLDPSHIGFYRELAGGVTSANLLHGSANPIGGKNQIVKLRWGAASPDEMFFEGAKPGIKFALGENVKQSNWGDDNTTRYPQTRMGVETIIRDRFQAAREYAEQWQRARDTINKAATRDSVQIDTNGVRLRRDLDRWIESARDGADWPSLETLDDVEREYLSRVLANAGVRDGQLPRRNFELEALAEILRGERLVHCHSYRQDEILMLCRVAEDFGFKIGTFQHGLEVYKVADVVKEHAIGASIFSDWWAYKVEVQDAIPYAGPIEAEVGVLTSYNSDDDGLARHLNLEAAKAVKYSDGRISPAKAFEFVTINPAIQLGIGDRVGSIETGKDADIVLWSGDPLSNFSRPTNVWVDGREYFSLEQDAAHRAHIAAERERLIAKVLKDDMPGEEGEGGPAGRRGRRPGRDTVDSPPRDSLLARYTQRLLEHAEADARGHCGCDTLLPAIYFEKLEMND